MGRPHPHHICSHCGHRAESISSPSHCHVDAVPKLVRFRSAEVDFDCLWVTGVVDGYISPPKVEPGVIRPLRQHCYMCISPEQKNQKKQRVIAAQGMMKLSRFSQPFHCSLIRCKIRGIIGRQGLTAWLPVSICNSFIPVSTSGRCGRDDSHGSGNPSVSWRYRTTAKYVLMVCCLSPSWAKYVAKYINSFSDRGKGERHRI